MPNIALLSPVNILHARKKSLGFESRRDFSSTFILDISYSFNPGLHLNFENVQRNLINDIFLNDIRTSHNKTIVK